MSVLIKDIKNYLCSNNHNTQDLWSLPVKHKLEMTSKCKEELDATVH